MSQKGQTHFKNPAVFAARFLKCVWPFWDITHYRVKCLLLRELFSAIVQMRLAITNRIFLSSVLDDLRGMKGTVVC